MLYPGLTKPLYFPMFNIIAYFLHPFSIKGKIIFPEINAVGFVFRDKETDLLGYPMGTKGPIFPAPDGLNRTKRTKKITRNEKIY